MKEQHTYWDGKGDRVQHRLDGPASVHDSGNMGWFVFGEKYTTTESYKKAAGLTDEQWFPILLKYGKVEDSRTPNIGEMIEEMMLHKLNEDWMLKDE